MTLAASILLFFLWAGAFIYFTAYAHDEDPLPLIAWIVSPIIIVFAIGLFEEGVELSDARAQLQEAEQTEVVSEE